MHDYVLDGTRHAKFVAIDLGVSTFILAAFCSPNTQNTSNDVAPGKEVSALGHDDYILYSDPQIFENPPFCGR